MAMAPEDAVTLAAKDFARALHQVVPAASADDARPILTGVLLAAEEGGLRLVATDSYRLAVRDLPGTSVLREGQSVLVPSRALRELERLLGSVEEVTLRLGEREATFEVGTTSLTTRLIEGEFPNYRGLIPASHPNRLTVGREALVEAVKRVKLMARELNTPVRLAMSADGLELVAITQDVGQAHEQLDAAYEGADLTVAFNPRLPAERRGGHPRRRDLPRHRRCPEARRHPGWWRPGVLVPAHAGAGLLTGERPPWSCAGSG